MTVRVREVGGSNPPAPTMEIQNLNKSNSQLAGFCKRWKVSELSIFGSALRADFSPNSDVDLLVSFTEDANWGMFDLVRMEDELKEIVGRNVDLIEKKAVERSENYIRRRGILEGAEIVFTSG